MEIVKGNKTLALKLGVHPQTVQKWRRAGILAPAVLAEHGRVIIYDLQKVFECLDHKQLKFKKPKK